MVTPWPRLASTPPLATPFVLGNGHLCVGGTGKPLRFHALDMLCDTLGCLGLGSGICRRRLMGQLAGVDHQKAYLCQVEASVRVLHWHTADDTLPMPLPGRLLPRSAGLFEQQGQGSLCLPPRLYLLAHHIGCAGL